MWLILLCAVYFGSFCSNSVNIQNFSWLMSLISSKKEIKKYVKTLQNTYRPKNQTSKL